MAAANNLKIANVREALKSEFKISDLGTPHSFLRIQFDLYQDRSVSIHQQEYIQKILTDFCIETSHPKQTLMNIKLSLNRSDDEQDLDDDAKSRFSSAVRALMYLIIGTRPDIAFILATLSRFVSRPQTHH